MARDTRYTENIGKYVHIDGRKVGIMQKYYKVTATMGRGEEYGMAILPNNLDKEIVLEECALLMQLSSVNTQL